MVPIPMKKLIASAFLDAAVVRNTPIEEHSVAINVAFYSAYTQKHALDNVLNAATVSIQYKLYAAEQLFDRKHQMFLIASLPIKLRVFDVHGSLCRSNCAKREFAALQGVVGSMLIFTVSSPVFFYHFIDPCNLCT